MMHHTKTSAPADVFCVAGGELPQSSCCARCQPPLRGSWQSRQAL